jgi:hypothetical protein
MLQCPVLATGIYSVQKLEEIAFDKDEPDEVRYSALETVLRSEPAIADRVVEKVLKSGNEETIRICLEVLIITRNSSANNILRTSLRQENHAEPVLVAFSKLLQFTGGTEDGDWLTVILGGDSVSDRLYVNALVALGTCRPRAALAYAKRASMGVLTSVRKVGLVSALARIDSTDGVSLLFKMAEQEDDVFIITEIIEALGHCSDPRATSRLAQWLDPARWSRNWPTPRVPLRRGEQRPDDLRRSAVVVALVKKGDVTLAEPLEAVAASLTENTSIRSIAAAAAAILREQALFEGI